MTPPTLPAPPPGVDLDADFVNITPERYTRVPRSSHRDGPHRLTSLLALGVLTLYLSNKTGWKIPNAETLAQTWKEGADRIRAAIADLERAGFLVRFRIQRERGRWVTRTFVSADPANLEQIRQYAAALAAAHAATKANKATTGDDGAFPQVGPDGGFRDSVDRDSVDRGSVTGDLKDQESALGEQEEEPPHPPLASAAAAEDQAATGGSDSLDDETRTMLNAAAAAAAAVRAGADGWKPAQIRAAVRAALVAEHPPALVAERLAQLAADTAGTAFPTRLRKLLDAEAAAAITAAARKADQSGAGTPPPWAEGPFRYLDNDRPRCHEHPGYPADNCGPCRTDARIAAVEAANALEDGAPPAPAASPPGSGGRAAALATAAAAKQTSPTRNASSKPAVPRVPRQATETAPAADPAPDSAADQTPEPAGVAA